MVFVPPFAAALIRAIHFWSGLRFLFKFFTAIFAKVTEAFVLKTIFQVSISHSRTPAECLYGITRNADDSRYFRKALFLFSQYVNSLFLFAGHKIPSDSYAVICSLCVCQKSKHLPSGNDGCGKNSTQMYKTIFPTQIALFRILKILNGTELAGQ